MGAASKQHGGRQGEEEIRTDPLAGVAPVLESQPPLLQLGQHQALALEQAVELRPGQLAGFCHNPGLVLDGPDLLLPALGL